MKRGLDKDGFADPRAPKHVEAPVAPESAYDDFAPFSGIPRCVDRNGYKRGAHRFDKDGRCLFCPSVSASIDPPSYTVQERRA